MSARDVCYVKTRRDLDNGAFLLSYRSVEHEVQVILTTSSCQPALTHPCVVCRLCCVCCHICCVLCCPCHVCVVCRASRELR
jgi:hypothetical protein